MGTGPNVPVIPPAASPYHAQDAVVTYPQRRFVAHHVLDQELTMLVSGFRSVHFGLCGMSFGACLTLSIALATLSLPEPKNIYFFAAAVVAGVLAVYFGVMAVVDWVRSARTVAEIRARPPLS